MNILFTCAGRRAYLLRYFRKELDDVCPGSKIYATDMQLNAPALAFADERIQVPSVYADDYLSVMLDICKQNRINLLISLNDLELPLLAENKKMFEQAETKLLVSSTDVIDICFDKYKTAQFITSIGLRSPSTYVDYFLALDAINTGVISFPLVLKPRWGSGSIGIEFVEDLEDLEIVYRLLHKKIKRSILSQVSERDNCVLIQEKIEGPEYGLDVMNDLRGNHVAVSVKRKLAMRAGETDKAVTVDNEVLRNIGHTIGSYLSHIGNLDCDILEKDGMYYVLELNPRFGGGFPFSYEAGVNMPKAVIEWMRGNVINPKMLVPHYNRMFAKCDYLVEIS